MDAERRAGWVGGSEPEVELVGLEQAGGAATDGRRPILDLVPKSLHQRTPLFIGSKADVAFASEILATASVPA